MLKICFTLAVFVVILVFTSLHITRKKYRLPRILRTLRLRHNADCLQLEGQAPVQALASGEAVAGIIPGGWVVLHRLELRGVKLPVQPFTCAPGWIRDESLGLLLSVASSERNVLAQLVEYAFQDIPEFRVETVVASEVRLMLQENLHVMDAFDTMARRVALRIILGLEEPGNSCDLETARKLRGYLDDLRCLHYGSTTLRTHHRIGSFFGVRNRSREFLSESKKTLEPLIRYEMENYDPADPQNLNTFLQTFMASRVELEEEGDQTNFLTVGHLAHAALDSIFVLEEILVPAFRWALLVLGERPELAERLMAELAHLRGRPGPFAEACALELLRWSLVGAQFGAHQLLEDWDAGEMDIPGGSVLLFDLRSFTRDAQLFRDPDSFYPQRFEARGKTVSRAKNAFIERLELAGWGACVPVTFLVDLLACGVANLAATFSIHVEGNAGLAPAVCSTDRMPAPFSFTVRER